MKSAVVPLIDGEPTADPSFAVPLTTYDVIKPFGAVHVSLADNIPGVTFKFVGWDGAGTGVTVTSSEGGPDPLLFVP
jgi:hypothetical protein